MFVLLMLFLFVILHTMCSGKSPQLLCILPFGILCLSAIRTVFLKIRVNLFMSKVYNEFQVLFLCSCIINYAQLYKSSPAMFYDIVSTCYDVY